MSDTQPSLNQLLSKLTVHEAQPSVSEQQADGETPVAGDYVKKLMEEAVERKKRCPLPPVELANEGESLITPRESKQVATPSLEQLSPDHNAKTLPSVELEANGITSLKVTGLPDGKNAVQVLAGTSPERFTDASILAAPSESNSTECAKDLLQKEQEMRKSADQLIDSFKKLLQKKDEISLCQGETLPPLELGSG